MSELKKKLEPSTTENFSRFEQVDGSHPLKQIAPESSVEYRVRKRKGGKVKAFNFDLAQEIGLIDEGQGLKLSKELETKILDTFGLIIINEFDHLTNNKFTKSDILPGTYMATRYLQLQHKDKIGKNSGDGRSIWNGQVSHKGKVWDLSSCGTGATCLSPATSNNQKFYESGDLSISYGCGYAEVDEGIAALLFSEILNKNNVATERVLAVLQFEKNYSITVRVHENLLRPSHLFRHLKQENFDALEKLVFYYIERQKKNKIWTDVPKSPKKQLDYFLAKQVEVFAKMTACFEDEYIFCWLDWDGDNILMDGSIIDYGSVRQFGLYHHEYRYDDVERFSTTIKEQKAKAKHLVQTFHQLIDYLKKGKRKEIGKFKNSSAVKLFEKHFEMEKNKNLLFKIGYKKQDIPYLEKHASKEIKEFRQVFTYFEKAKSSTGLHQVGDGVTWDAIFCMRDILRELPQLYVFKKDDSFINCSEFIDIAKSTYSTEKDLIITSYRRKQVKKFQEYYMKLVDKIAKYKDSSPQKILQNLVMRSSIINKYDRVTGDSITSITQKIISHQPKLDAVDIFQIVKRTKEYQNFIPDLMKKKNGISQIENERKIMKDIFKIVRDYREGL